MSHVKAYIICFRYQTISATHFRDILRYQHLLIWQNTTLTWYDHVSGRREKDATGRRLCRRKTGRADYERSRNGNEVFFSLPAMMPRTHTVFVLVFTVLSFHTTSNKPKTKFCLGLKLELLYFRKKNLFIFHIWDRICRCRRQETFQFSKPKYFICEVEEKWFGRYKITPHILGVGPKWNAKTTLLPPVRGNNLSDTIWPFHGFLALGLEKFTAWLYTAMSFS